MDRGARHVFEACSQEYAFLVAMQCFLSVTLWCMIVKIRPRTIPRAKLRGGKGYNSHLVF